MRTFLFVPGDSTRKFESARKTAADVLILDLEDSVAPDQKIGARDIVRDMLKARDGRQQLYVRINALDSGLTLGDLAAITPLKPDGVILPKCEGGADIDKASLYLDAFETAYGVEPGHIKIIPVATETAMAVLKLDTYAGCSKRLIALTWGGEDLAASLGASSNRTNGRFHSPYLLARDLCLISAVAAGVTPIDTIAADIDNLDALREESIAARRDGFLGKMVIHPKHVDVVNAAFTPSEEEVAHATKIVEAFRNDPKAGVVKIDGKMIDKPHLRAAMKVLGIDKL
jgi:citrate lyase subunit beta/citryl-CoA lyase